MNVLAAHDVEVVFGIPGAHIVELYEALRHCPTIRHFVMRHEQGASFAADGYARASGSPGICLVTTGPGATNALTGLSGAYADSSPVLLLAGQIDSSLIGLGKGVLHEVPDQIGMFRSVTKFAASPRDAAGLAAAVDEALFNTMNGRPQPAYVELPTDLLGSVIDARDPGVRTAFSASPDAESIGRAAHALARARHPLIVAGGGAIWARASLELKQLAELLSAPILTTAQGKGAIAADDPLFAGCIHPHHGGSRDLIANADVALVVGSRLDEQTTGRWSLPFRRIIQLDIDPRQIGRTYSVETAIVADARAGLDALASHLTEGSRSEWGRRAARRACDLTAQSISAVRRAEFDMVGQLRASLPREMILTNDDAYINSWMQWFWPAYEPRSYLCSGGAAALGFALPAAIGASIAAPDLPVLAVCGDGGFLFTASELATCAKYDLNVTVLIANDNRFGSIANLQLRSFGKASETDLVNPDFVAFARSFGVPAWRVETLADVAPVVARAVAAKGPAVVELTEPIGSPWDPVLR